jgi:sigma-B regulation protein RsbU (phosphoserine phosphatase)
MNHPNPPPPPSDPAEAHRRLATLIEMVQIFNSSLDLRVVVERVMECAMKAFAAEASSLLLLDHETGDLVWVSAAGEVGEKVLDTGRLPRGAGIAGWVLDNRQPALVRDAYADSRFDPTIDQKTGFRTRSMMCVPLIVRGELVGVAQVINREGQTCFSDADLEFFRPFCDNAAIAIQNALLHQELIRQERQKQDFELARSIQQSLLSDPPSNLRTYQISVQNRPALHVGGDFYEFFRIGPDDYFFCIGDVAGKGVPAALYMAGLVGDIRYLAIDLKDPAAVLMNLNTQLLDRGSRTIFVTLLAGRLRDGKSELVLCNAGHPPPVRLRRTGGPEMIQVPGQPPLGIVQQSEFRTLRTHLMPGERLLLYTDGMTEVMNRAGQPLGDEGLLAWLAGWDKDGEALITRLFEQVLVQGGVHAKQDDLTAMVIDRFR